MKRTIATIKTIPFQGGCSTAVEPALLDGKPSLIQNFRQRYPGLVQRPGQIKQHSTADSTNKVQSLYQFVKAIPFYGLGTPERYFYSQFSDGDVLEATTAPPGVTTGVFGSEVYSGTASTVPASWANVNDLLLYANGVNTPQIYPGVGRFTKFIVYKGTSAIPIVPEIGDDYTYDVSDYANTDTFANVSSLGDLAVDFDCVFICAPVPFTHLYVFMKTVNGTAAVLAGNYWNGAAFTGVSGFSDGTADTGKTLASDGDIAWAAPTDWYPSYMFGTCGYWLQLYLSSGDLDSDTKIYAAGYIAPWQSMSNVWDGVPVAIAEAQLYDSSSATYATYSADITLSGADSNGDLLYLACADPSCGFYIDVGDTPVKCQSIATVKYWNGSSFATASSISDGTSGLTKSGWLTFARQTDMQKYRLNGSIEAYWYQITIPQQSAVVCLNFDGIRCGNYVYRFEWQDMDCGG